MRANFKKYICAALAAAMLAPLSSAYAKEWVHVSSWAYNDVSNFTNEGLLPESFDSVSDYRAPITVEQFCELLYSVGIKSGMLTPRTHDDNNVFIDSDNEAVNTILQYNSLVTEQFVPDMPAFVKNDAQKKDYCKNLYPSVSFFSNGNRYFFSKANPSNPLSRECAANIITGYKVLGPIMYDEDNFLEITEVPEDISYPNAAPEAYRGIYLAKLYGLMDASADPKSDMTIEQAITAVYRLWKAAPIVSREDGSGIMTDTETLIQTYANGVEEYKVPMNYLLKKDGAILKRFESDIYKNIYCADTADGRRIAAAQTYNKDTEIYNLADGSMIAKLNYLTNGMDSEYIITKSSDMRPMYFGLCAYDGSTVLEPCYSMEEIGILRNNGFKRLEMPYRKPDGWIYYSDWNDNGKMYRIDSNGENKQLLCGEDCFDTAYADGRLYYSVRGENENKLFCMKADGTEKEQVSQSEAYIIRGKLADSGETFSDAIDGRVYYIEADQLANRSNAPGYLWSIRHTDSGTVKEQISDIPLSPLARDETCIYLKDPICGDGYILDKNGLKKLDLNGLLNTIRIFGEGAECTVYSSDNKKKTLCAPRGSSEFTDCTHEHLYTNPNVKNSYTYSINYSLSDENYQLGTSSRIGEGAWIYNRKTAEFKTNVFSDKLLARTNNILYLKSDSKIYAYNLDTGEKKTVAYNVLSTDTVSGSIIPFIDTDKKLCCLDLNNGTIQKCSVNGNVARYCEFTSLKQDSFTKHLIKRCSNGGYFDLTNSSAMYYGYVEYTDKN